jgi:molybdenum cofactor cytidylyltransferase
VIGGLVLAAGAGTRFGGPKQVAELHGRPLMCHALEALVAVPAIERRAVVLGARADEIRARVSLDAFEVVVCDEWEEGMSASLRAGVRRLRECEAVVVLLADQPGVTPQVIAQVAHAVRDGVAAVRATYGGEPGHPVLIAHELFPRVLELRGDTGARDLLADVRAEQIEVGELARGGDVDTPDQLEAMRS